MWFAACASFCDAEYHCRRLYVGNKQFVCANVLRSMTHWLVSQQHFLRVLYFFTEYEVISFLSFSAFFTFFGTIVDRYLCLISKLRTTTDPRASPHELPTMMWSTRSALCSYTSEGLPRQCARKMTTPVCLQSDIQTRARHREGYWLLTYISESRIHTFWLVARRLPYLAVVCLVLPPLLSQSLTILTSSCLGLTLVLYSRQQWKIPMIWSNYYCACPSVGRFRMV